MLALFPTTKSLSFFLLILITTFSPAYCQTEQDYTPLPYSKVFPQNFSEDYKEKIASKVEKEKRLSKNRALKFYETFYQSKAYYFSSGQIYFENKLHNYVNAVAVKLFEQNPDILKQLKIYVARSTSSNAWAMPDGTIFINVGLLARLENEAQLAAIIAHEASHVELNHSVKSLSKIDDIKSQQINYENEESEVVRRLKYSREDESEADSKAVQYLMASKYDPHEFPKALAMISNEDYFKIDSLQEMMRKHLFFDHIPVDTLWFAKKYSEESEIENASIVFSLQNDDRYSTHPDINKRISATNEILNLVEFNGDGRFVNLLGKESEEVKTIALFECIEGLEKEAAYNSALYVALYALKKYPENAYLKTAVAKNLYWLSFYKEIDCIKNVIDESGEVCRDNFGTFNYFLTKIPHNDLKKLMFAYTKQNYNQYQGKDEFFFYYGLCSEMYLGKDAGKLIFSQYPLKFPNGKYLSAVKSKLQ